MANVEKNKQKKRWLAKLVARDHKAFAQLVDRYKASIFLCCKTLGLDQNQADDIASETFLAAYKGIAKFRAQADIGTWLWKIAYFKAVSYIRKNSRTHELLHQHQENIVSKEHQPSDALENDEKKEIIYSAVQKLPKLWAMVVILYYREQKTITDIAKIMKINKNTVKTYLFRARNELKQMLTPVFGADDVI